SFNAHAPTAIYTLSLHDALPIYRSASLRGGAASGRGGARSTPGGSEPGPRQRRARPGATGVGADAGEALPRAAREGPDRAGAVRSEEHTSELQSLAYLVCRLLLE